MCSIAWATVVSSRTATNSGDMRRPAVPSVYSRSSWTSSDFSSSISSRISSACSLGSSSTTSTTCSGGIRSRTRETSTSGSEPTSSRSVGSSSSASTSPACWGVRRRKRRTWSSGGSSRITRDTSAGCASSRRSARRSSRPSPRSCLIDSFSRSASAIPPRSMTPLRRGARRFCPAPPRERGFVPRPQAPNLVRRRALAITSGIRCWAGIVPRLPPAQARSVKAVAPSAPQ